MQALEQQRTGSRWGSAQKLTLGLFVTLSLTVLNACGNDVPSRAGTTPLTTQPPANRTIESADAAVGEQPPASENEPRALGGHGGSETRTDLRPGTSIADLRNALPLVFVGRVVTADTREEPQPTPLSIPAAREDDAAPAYPKPTAERNADEPIFLETNTYFSVEVSTVVAGLDPSVSSVVIQQAGGTVIWPDGSVVTIQPGDQERLLEIGQEYLFFATSHPYNSAFLNVGPYSRFKIADGFLSAPEGWEWLPVAEQLAGRSVEEVLPLIRDPRPIATENPADQGTQ